MKKLILLVALVFATFNISKVLALGPTATIEWETTSVDLGDVPIKKPVTVEFVFKNPGMVPIIISEVKPSCGCTVADFPKQPILSGAQGKITVTYDAELSGFFSKTVTVYSNTEDKVTELFIKGTVIK
jgi:hypothetical protein